MGFVDKTWRLNMDNNFKQYRVTKYNPIYRVNGIYTKDEWISMYDVGKSYGEEVFTFEEYLAVEKSYLNVIKKVLQESNVKRVRIKQGENIYSKLNNSVLRSQEEVLLVARGCLREEFWCKLVSKNFFVHFGYDYYMYIGANIEEEHMSEIARENDLFIELIERSPYF